MVKALVLFSGGLDSRLAIKLLQEKDIEIEAVFFILPLGGGCCNNPLCVFRFAQEQYIKLYVIDCTKGKLLEEYLEIIKNPKYKTGSGINPCIDCRTFMLKRAEKLRKKIKADFLATGEVLGERPMSQTKNALEIIDREVGLKDKIKRPLIELGIKGRKRNKQIELARKFNIDYPTPGGGCLLCEKALALRFKFLLKKNFIDENTLLLTKIGRHFYKKRWFVVGRNEQENLIIEKFKNSIKSGKGQPAVYFYCENKQNKDLNLREKFKKYRL